MRESIKDFYFRYLRYFQAKDNSTATNYDKYLALAYAVRSQMVDNWIDSQGKYHESNPRRIYYLSTEYVLGKSLGQNIVNLDIEESVSTAARELGFSLEDVLEKEDDFELGNGGKGRLAACILDSMATLGLPGMGYGLRYDYGQFRQEIRGGLQHERPYDWLHKGHPWEILRPEYSCEVNFNGQSVPYSTDAARRSWVNTDKVIAVPYDLPIPGYHNGTVNTLRLWSSRAAEEFLADYQHHGDYVRACEENGLSGKISHVLFPEENVLRATEKRLKQQYFFVSASLQDILRRYKLLNATMDNFDKKVAIQLNGSRCALAIVELMRLLVDIEGVPWDDAWRLVQNVFSYTSHAVSKDDLDNWPVYLVSQVFPRHMEIVFEINQKHLDKVRSEGGDRVRQVPELSLIEEGEVKRIRMAQLALLGSSVVNGVSKAQTEALVKRVFPALASLAPEKIVCKTSGVAHRRWLLTANRPLAALITEAIGERWIRHAQELVQLEKLADDPEFLQKLYVIKQESKRKLAEIIRDVANVKVSPEALFDVQSKRIHPYKRQMLHILHVLWRYLSLKSGKEPLQPRVHLFAGKATPSDHLAKQIIHLINATADLINNDPQTSDRMSVVFIPNYGVHWAERLVPSANLSEQISAARIEACGTSNMKFAFNGALTIMSKSGSNLELLEHIGHENIVAFGKTEEELPASGAYRPSDIIAGNDQLKAVFGLLEGVLAKSPGGSAINPLIATLRDSDEYHVLLDYADYVGKQEEIDKLYRDRSRWLTTSLHNIARLGWFSSDRLVAEYARDIWKIDPAYHV